MPSSRQGPSKPSSLSRSSKPRTADEIREAEYDAFVRTSISTHSGYLSKPILSLSTSLDISPLHTSYILAGVFFLFDLVTPAFFAPHVSALVTLLIPVQNTLQSVAYESAGSKDGKQGTDGAQWCAYWVVYCLLDMMRGWVYVFRPGWTAVFEVGKMAGLVAVGGPWFGRAGLRPDPPSEELKKAEKKEEAADEARNKAEQKAKAKKDKEAKEKAEKEKKKEKEVAKANKK